MFKLLSTQFCRLAIAALASLACSMALAQFPDKPVNIIVPTSPGGIADTSARLIAAKLAILWGQPVVVLNKTGAGSQIGFEAAAQSKADGYTLLMGYDELATFSAFNPQSKLKPINDFTPVAKIGTIPAVILTNPAFKANNLPDLIKELKARPGKYTYASSGPGTSLQLFGEQFKQAAKVDVLIVPYKGSVNATLGVVAGEVDMIIQLASANVTSMIKSGRLKPIAAATPARIERFPDVPTTSEAGLPGFLAIAWYGLFTPAGVPPDVLTKINSDVAKVVAMPDVQERLTGLGISSETASLETFRAFFNAEIAQWGKIVTESAIKRD